MKTITAFLAMITIGIVAMAQTETAPAAPKDAQQKTQQAPVEKKTAPQREFVKMTEGKVIYVKGNEETILEKEVTLGETKVKPDGTIVAKDGATSMMKEGTIVNVNGRLIDMSSLKQKPVGTTPPQKTAAPK